ncbi:EpsG family protein [Cryobacterium sp. N19]|uniref:EpsG family protein n=1 Tax=Cryobacterium sp. N19 TaxID=2048288 RepID=UPI001304B7D1|nr:EpsG family protein [Cryobacterium sp. N19]
MLAYYLLTVVLGILSTASRFIDNSLVKSRRQPAIALLTRQVSLKWNPFDFLVVSVLVAFSALRFEVGTDYAAYASTFSRIQPQYWQETLAHSPQEFGYTVMTLALKLVSESPRLLFWVTSILTVVPIYVTIKKKSLDPTLSILLYVLLAFYVAPFNVIRQGMAIGLNFWASTFLEKNKIAFCAINFVASLFHVSALLIAVIQLLIHRWRPGIRGLSVLLVLGIASAGLVTNVSALSDLVTLLNPRYESYLLENATGIGTFLVIAAKLALLSIAVYLTLGSNRSPYITYVAFGVVFLFLGTQALVLARIEGYFSIFLILLLPNALMEGHLAPKVRGVVEVLLLVMASVYFAVYLQNYGDLIPYKTIPSGIY